MRHVRAAERSDAPCNEERPGLEGEVERRFPGEYLTTDMADANLRTLLIADDQGHREVFDKTIMAHMNKLGRKMHDLANVIRTELGKMAQTIRNFQKAIKKQTGDGNEHNED